MSAVTMGLNGDEKPHVLVVDDSFLDRKIIERLLTNSSCKGIYIILPYTYIDSRLLDIDQYYQL